MATQTLQVAWSPVAEVDVLYNDANNTVSQVKAINNSPTHAITGQYIPKGGTAHPFTVPPLTTQTINVANMHIVVGADGSLSWDFEIDIQLPSS